VDRLEATLDLLGGNVLSARGLEQVLLAIGYAQEAVLVDRADVARLEETGLVEDILRLVGFVVVAAHDERTADEDLAVGGEPALHARDARPDGAELVAVDAVDVCPGRRLGQPVT